MRITSGTAKGRTLLTPKGAQTRPTADKIKQSLFNIISPDLNGASFLDLFAGSGAIGLEALSRGAAKCVFVEKDRSAMSVLCKNIENAKFSDISETYLADSGHALALLSKMNYCFDIIFMDPPYVGAAVLMKRLTAAIKELSLLSSDGYIVGEHGADIDIDELENIIPIKKKSYGKTTVISFWRPK